MNLAKVTLVIAACAASAACGKNTASGESTGSAIAPGSAEAVAKVAFLLSTLQEERYKKDQKYFEAMARREGMAPFTLSADNDNARQLSQVEDSLSRKAKVLV